MTCACMAAIKVALHRKDELTRTSNSNSKKAYNISESIQIVVHGFDRLDMLEGESPWLRLNNQVTLDFVVELRIVVHKLFNHIQDIDLLLLSFPSTISQTE